MGRKAKDKQQQIQDLKAHDRKQATSTSDSYNAYQAPAGRQRGPPSNSNNSHAGTTCQHAKPYLSLKQLKDMHEDNKVVIEVIKSAGEAFHIYTTANLIVVLMKWLKSDINTQGRKPLTEQCKSAHKDIQRQNPEELYHKMNTGTDEDLLRWQQFSKLCLQSVLYQHAFHGVPLRVWVDDEELPPAKRVARERARLTGYKSGMMTDILTKPAASSSHPPAPAHILEELGALGDVGVVELNMKGLIDQDVVIRAPKEAVQDIYNSFQQQFMGQKQLKVAEKTYKQLVAILKNYDPKQHKWGFMDDKFVDAAVLARLLYNQPLPVMYKPEYPTLPVVRCLEGEVPTAVVNDPTPEMMHPITIPTCVADKGGYIVAGYFRLGRGIETVHLKFSDFKQDDDIMLHLGIEPGSCLLAPRMPNKVFINELIHARKITGSKKASAERVIEMINQWHESNQLPGSSTVQAQVVTEDLQQSTELKRSCSAGFAPQFTTKSVMGHLPASFIQTTCH